jgi:hypothetical protein
MNKEVSYIEGWETLIGRDLLDQLSDLEGQLNRKVIECPGAADLADRGDDLSKGRLAGFGVVIVRYHGHDCPLRFGTETAHARQSVLRRSQNTSNA